MSATPPDMTPRPLVELKTLTRGNNIVVGTFSIDESLIYVANSVCLRICQAVDAGVGELHFGLAFEGEEREIVEKAIDLLKRKIKETKHWEELNSSPGRPKRYWPPRT